MLRTFMVIGTDCVGALESHCLCLTLISWETWREMRMSGQGFDTGGFSLASPVRNPGIAWLSIVSPIRSQDTAGFSMDSPIRSPDTA